MNKAALEAAYRNTEYVALLERGELVLRADRADAIADQRLRLEAGVHSSWAIITPCNPRSRQLSGADNNAALARFLEELARCGRAHFPAVNRDPTGRWPDERGALLVDPTLESAQALGRTYEQHAILFGRLQQAPQLVWLES